MVHAGKGWKLPPINCRKSFSFPLVVEQNKRFRIFFLFLLSGEKGKMHLRIYFHLLRRDPQRDGPKVNLLVGLDAREDEEDAFWN